MMLNMGRMPGVGLVKGLSITLRHMLRKSVTQQYPEVKPALPPRSRGVIALVEENCTSCMLCARECPDWCIYIDSHKETIPAPEGGRPRQRNVLDRFAIDFSLCMYCGICIEVCPFDALFWSPEFEYAEGDIRDLLHEKERLGAWVQTVPPPPAHDPGAEPPKELTAARRPARTPRPRPAGDQPAARPRGASGTDQAAATSLGTIPAPGAGQGAKPTSGTEQGAAPTSGTEQGAAPTSGAQQGAVPRSGTGQRGVPTSGTGTGAVPPGAGQGTTPPSSGDQAGTPPSGATGETSSPSGASGETRPLSGAGGDVTPASGAGTAQGAPSAEPGPATRPSRPGGRARRVMTNVRGIRPPGSLPTPDTPAVTRPQAPAEEVKEAPARDNEAVRDNDTAQNNDTAQDNDTTQSNDTTQDNDTAQGDNLTTQDKPVTQDQDGASSTGDPPPGKLSTAEGEPPPKPDQPGQTAAASPRRRRMADPRSIRPPGRLGPDEPRESEEES